MMLRPLFSLGLLAIFTFPALAGEPPNVAGATAARASHAAQTARRRPRGVDTCSGAGANSFLGVQGVNLAGGTDSSVLSGSSNTVCVSWSAIATGQSNTVSAIGGGFSANAFIGGGYQNTLTGPYGMIGAGNSNTVTGSESMIGAGDSNQVAGTDNFIGAGSTNQIAANDTAEATITGGTGNLISTSYASVIGGGDSNAIEAQNSLNFVDSGGTYGAIGGGYSNSIVGAADGSAMYATIGGGGNNSIKAGQYGTVAGGYNNSLTGTGAAIGGGESNMASGFLAAIPGGYKNVASGTASFAAGFGALAEGNGTFVWSDYSPGAPHLGTTAVNQFLARASGGFSFFSDSALTSGVRLAPGSGTWSSLSDRNMKTAIEPIDGAAVLAKVEHLPVSEWSYTSEPGVRHIGPMAQDFYATFRVGEDDRHITTIDEDGVALAAVKALHAENVALREAGLRQRARDLMLTRRLANLESETAALRQAFAHFEEGR